MTILPPAPVKAEKTAPFSYTNDKALYLAFQNLLNLAEVQKLPLENYENANRTTDLELKRYVNNIFNSKVNEALASFDLTNLEEFPSNIPPSVIRSLNNEGLLTLSDVQGYVVEDYTKVHGIGPTRAEDMERVVNAHIQEVILRTKVNVDASDASEELRFLLEHRIAFRKLQNVYENLNIDAEFIHHLNEVPNAYVWPLSTFGRFFTGRKKKTEVREQLLQYMTEADSSTIIKPENVTITLNNAYNTYISSYNSDAASILKEFKQKPVPYIAMLERYVVKARLAQGVATRSTGELADAIYNEIEKVELNLNFFTAELRGYQEFGAKYALNQKRTLLGDDAGLGKTIQAIAVMSHLSATHADAHVSKGKALTSMTHIVVVPLSLQRNWFNEVKNFSELKPFIMEHRNQEVSYDDYDVIITTFERLSDPVIKNADGSVIVDEAHFVKNRKAQRTQNVARLIYDKEYVMLMSGTALENKLEELTELLILTNPALKEALDGKTFDTPAAYKKAIAGTYLRRNKEDVLNELPELIIQDEALSMGLKEQIRYKFLLQKGQGNTWHDLMRTSYSDSDFAKAVRVKEILEEAVALGEKVLVFSFYLDTLAMVETIAKDIMEVYKINGSVSAEERQGVVDSFNNYEFPAVMISQIGTGGVGLNMQSASRIILCEPQIKPSLELQAFSRAHRMGQLNTVFVQRLVVEDSLDAGVVLRRDDKNMLFQQYAKYSALGDKSVGIEISSDVQRALLNEQRKFWLQE
jgi:SNF2 family DNA or RNA helicase